MGPQIFCWKRKPLCGKISVYHYAQTCISDGLNGCHIHQTGDQCVTEMNKIEQYAFKINQFSSVP